MKRYTTILISALIMTTGVAMNGNSTDPFEAYLTAEIERLELEQELFGLRANTDEVISIAAIEVFELNEEVCIGFDTAAYLPVGFDARKGMNDINWDEVKLYTPEEDLELDVEISSFSLER
ncbi:MAG: hypothetical protein KJO25_02205 [Bacteroidia bacterium]|nr:hypothetical protein [Bacteroidia bacterium]